MSHLNTCHQLNSTLSKAIQTQKKSPNKRAPFENHIFSHFISFTVFCVCVCVRERECVLIVSLGSRPMEDVCVYMCVYIYIHVYIHIKICVCIYVCIYTYIYVCIYTLMCVYTREHTHKHTHTPTHIHTHKNTHKPTFMVWQGAVIIVPWSFHEFNKTHAYMWHDSIIRVTWLVYTCDMSQTHSWVRHATCLSTKTPQNMGTPTSCGISRRMCKCDMSLSVVQDPTEMTHEREKRQKCDMSLAFVQRPHRNHSWMTHGWKERHESCPSTRTPQSFQRVVAAKHGWLKFSKVRSQRTVAYRKTIGVSFKNIQDGAPRVSSQTDTTVQISQKSAPLSFSLVNLAASWVWRMFTSQNAQILENQLASKLSI